MGTIQLISLQILSAIRLQTGTVQLAPMRERVPVVSVAAGLDTLDSDVAGILTVVRGYLQHPDSVGWRSPYWGHATPRDITSGDLLRSLVYTGNPAIVLDVLAADRSGERYVVKILYARTDSTTRRIRSIILQRVYADFNGTAWKLGNALPRLTRHWQHMRVGPIVFWYAPGIPQSSVKAARAAQFVASVAKRFGITQVNPIDYYVTHSGEECYQILGLDYYPLPGGRGSGGGGQGLPNDRIVLSGNPELGEDYLHELVHVVLGHHTGVNAFIAEGEAVWLGGSSGRSPQVMYRLLREYQLNHPRTSLEDLIRDRVPDWGVSESDALYASRAVFVREVARRHGVSELTRLLTTANNPEATIDLLSSELLMDRDGIDQWWRTTTTALADSSSSSPR